MRHYYIHLPSGSLCHFQTKEQKEHYFYAGQFACEDDAHIAVQAVVNNLLNTNQQLLTQMYKTRYQNHYPYFIELLNTNAALEFQFRESLTS